MKGIEELPLKYILIVLVAVIVISAIIGVTTNLTGQIEQTTGQVGNATSGATFCSICKINASTGQACAATCKSQCINTGCP